MKRLSLAGFALALLGAAGSASAQDAGTWTGIYAGLAPGMRTTAATWSISSWSVGGTACPLALICSPTFTPNPSLTTSGTYDSTAFRIGGFFGYNYQVAPMWVVGAEGDFGWGDNNAHQPGANPGAFQLESDGFPPLAGDQTNVKTTWDASVRARGGYLVTPALLAYGTAGVALQTGEFDATCGGSCPVFFTGVTGPTSVKKSFNKVGWTVGGGIEMKARSNILVRAEYRYADFGTENFSYTYLSGPRSPSYGTSVTLHTHIVLFGVAYKFD